MTTLVDDWTVAHHSGRFSRSPQSLASVFNVLRATGARRIGFTEISDPARRAALVEACRRAGWRLAYLGGDVGIAYDLAAFEVLEAMPTVVAELPYDGPRGHPRAPFTVLTTLVRSRTSGLTYLDSIGHTPAHVATADGWRGRTTRVLAHWRGCRAWWADYRSKARLWRPTGGRMLSADWNIDLRRAFARAYLRATFPALRLIADVRWVDTHDHRTVDAFLVGRSLRLRGRIRVLRTKASDHLSVLVRLVRRHTKGSRR